MPASTRAVTRCRRLPQDTPTQWQKDVLVVQLPPRTPKGSESPALKERSAERSVLLLGVAEDTSVTASKTNNDTICESLAMPLEWCLNVIMNEPATIRTLLMYRHIKQRFGQVWTWFTITSDNYTHFSMIDRLPAGL
jgi:hypothetical protein